VLRTPSYMHTFVYEHPEFGFEDVRESARRRCWARWAKATS
jgi:hypothetical protein